MIKISKENLLKDTIDYEEYSSNVCNPTLDELKEAGLLQCGGCCLKGGNKNSNCGGCSGCESKKCCKK